MARRRKLRVNRRGEEELPEFRLKPQTKRGILVVLFFALAVLSLLSLFDSAGSLGRIFGQFLGLLLGTAGFLGPIIFLALAVGLLLNRRESKDGRDVPVSNLRVYLGVLFFTLALTGILHLLAMRAVPDSAFELVKRGEGGGYLGLLPAMLLFGLLDFWASSVILAAVLLGSIVLFFNLDLAALPGRLRSVFSRGPGETRSMPDVKINKMEPLNFTTTKVVSPPPLPAADEEPEVEEVEVEETVEVDDDAEDGEGQEEASIPKVEARFRKGVWQPPPLEILEDSSGTVDSGNIEQNVAIIQKTLADFGIEVEMGEVNVGPTVTQYTLRPAQGVKLSQILALQNDLALALAAPSIRLEAPIPGKALAGVEIPNRGNALVRIKDIVSSPDFLNHKSSLAFSLGRDVAGKPVVADLARMPHLLIAGATGTGKSIAINSMLISFLYRNSPEELRFIVIDPKRVELNLYNGIPHLLTAVVTDYEKAVNALRWAVAEMDRRYNLLAQRGKRNIIEYNSGAEDKLPYIVIIVDELADLMAVAQADVEAAVVRLAQMARAVGVHLVLATQRPSVDIITGLIKANITARMAFAVASQVDSRTILDMAGAEKLLGAGDMLYVTAELGKPRRIQGTYISEKEVRGVVDFVQEQAGKVQYDETILEKQRVGGSAGSGGGDEGEDDDLLPEALEVIRSAGKASASLLQRRLRVGYARAARLLDLMEERGHIGPADGAKPRDVYFDNMGEQE